MPAKPPDPFEAWLDTDFPAADGFDFARGREASEVRSVGHGRVAFAGDCGSPWGRVVMIDHLFYENHERRQIRSVYRRLAMLGVRGGDVVRRGESVGKVKGLPTRGPAGALDMELRWDTTSPTCAPPDEVAASPNRAVDASRFIPSRRRLPVPQEEPALLLVSSRERKLRVRLRGERVGDFEVAFGQQAGRKRLQHDLRTPLGMYFVVGKSRGPFTGPYGAYYGGHWIKINYPNADDAEWGREQGLLTEEAAKSIGDAWRRRMPTRHDSPLGGGIGFHGWSDDWDPAGPRGLSWGCVVMRNDDIRRLFDRIPIGAMVVILR